MKIPYNQVHVNGDILFAARSGRIHTFRLADGKIIASWQHPDAEKVSNAVESNKTSALVNEASTTTEVDTPQDDASEPPAKRQKTTAEEDVSQSKPNYTAQDGGPKKGRRQKGKNKEGVVSRVPDRPMVTHLTSTADGKHVLAVTGHDKTIWIFEHDGEGHLTQISQRWEPRELYM